MSEHQESISEHSYSVIKDSHNSIPVASEVEVHIFNKKPSEKLIENHLDTINQKSKETSKNENSTENSEAANKAAKKNRELKSILELSKEANLNTNISHKRKSIEATKVLDKMEISNKFSENIKKTIKIQEGTDENDKQAKEKTIKRKRENLTENAGGASDDKKKSRKAFKVNLTMCKVSKFIKLNMH